MQYSQCPKTERSDFGQRWNLNDQLFSMVLFRFRTFWIKAILFGIWTFGFQSFGNLVPIVWNPNVQISDSWYQKVPTIWNPNILFKFQTQICWISVWNRNKCVWISDSLWEYYRCLKFEHICLDFKHKFVKLLSEIQTMCSVWDNSVPISDRQNCLKFKQICSNFSNI